MNVHIRPLRPDDIRRVVEIEREAFPTLWPPTPFKRELNNHRAQYLVAWQPNPAEILTPGEPAATATAGTPKPSVFGRLVGAVKMRLSSKKPVVQLDHTVLGFVGLWFMGDEAHIITIAVDEASRGKGIGELLLIGSIEMAMRKQATLVSLEARVSNYVAQSLYQKHSFRKVGTRKAYYTDNREDAAIMTAQPINTTAYAEKFHALTEAYRQRHGDIRIELT